MSPCNENVPVLRIMALLIVCLSGVYLYLYTNAFDGMRTSSVIRVVEGDLKVIQHSAVWKDKVGSISYYLKLLRQNDQQLEIQLSSASTSNVSNVSSTNEVEPTKETTTVKIVTKEERLDLLKKAILNKESLPLLTLFTSWGYSADKNLVHNLTAVNWESLKPFVIPVIFTNESAVAEACTKRGWKVFPIMQAAAGDIPVLKSMFLDVIKAYNTTYYGFANGDILFTDSLLDTLTSLHTSGQVSDTPTLIVGKRTNVDNVTMAEGSDWGTIAKIAKSRGKLFTGYAEDYFITQRSFPWKDMAEVVIGRRAYDNWLVVNSRKAKHVVIDATGSVLAVHQTTKAGNFEGHGHKNRDYNHNLLVKLYKQIKYNAGVVDCIEKYTKNEGGKINLKSRTVGKGCAV